MTNIETAPWEWQFPPCRKWIPTDSHTRRDQALKIIEEAEEAMKVRDGYDIAYAMELMDTIHACETALRELPESLLTNIKYSVVRKNYERGYYDDAECDR